MRHLGVEPDCLAIAPPGLGEMSQGAIGVAEVVVCLRHFGLQGDGGLAMRQGLVGTARFEQELPEVGSRRGELGVELDGSPHVFERPRFVAQLAQGCPEIGVGHRVVGSRIEHCQECSGRLGMTPQDMQRQPKIIAGGRVVEPESNRFSTVGDSFFELPKGTMHFRQRRVINSYAGLQGDGLADQP